MTLYRQIVIVIVLLSILQFIGTVVINVDNTRDYLETQLESHAQDAATSLGLSLSAKMAVGDVATMESMVDAVFDRGYYKDITLRRINGEVITSRHSDLKIENVPEWLIDWVKLDVPRSSAIVMSGWQQAGEVQVESYSGFAYQTLWTTMVNMLWWFTCLTVVLLILAGVAVRMLLRPLAHLEAQALSIGDRRFDEIQQIPRTRELRHLIKAMNYMTGKVKQMFEDQSESTETLRSLAFQDPLTGLQNRRYFDAALTKSLHDNTEVHEGALLLIQIQDLQGINQRLGFAAGDDLLKAAAQILRDCIEAREESVVAKLAGGDFAVIAEHINQQQAAQLADEICRRLTRLHAEQLHDDDKVCCVGVAMYCAGMPRGDVLARADGGLQTARHQGANTWAVYAAPEQSEMAMPGRQAWHGIVREAVASEEVILHAQPVKGVGDDSPLLHREILLRLPGPDDILWTAGMFLPAAEQIGLARELDQIVVKKVLAELRQSPADAHFAINISAASLHQTEFIDWLDATLGEANALTGSMVFELSESTVVRELARVQQLAETVRRHGYGFAVDHFGRGMTAFGYLQSLRPDYVKIDGLYMVDIANNQDDQFFVSSLCKVAHSLDITVIAESIENDAQLTVLNGLGVDGVQGYGVGRPGAL